MYFTLAVSATTQAGCAALVQTACDADPRIMPVSGPALVAWRAPDGRAAVLCWPGEATLRNPSPPGRRHSPGPTWPTWAISHAGTIWVEPGARDQATVCAAPAWPASIRSTWPKPHHPDVVIAAMIADCLGVEHTVTEPRPPGTADEADVLGRLRSAVLVSDGMLSAFENVGSGVRPDQKDPSRDDEPVQAGGHGGELLRGGYAQAAWCTPAALGAARAAELFRRMTTRRLSLLRPAPAWAYLASLAPSAAARGPRAAARARRLLPGESRGPVVGRRPADLSAPVSAGPAPVRRPRGAGRARRSAPAPDERPPAP